MKFFSAVVAAIALATSASAAFSSCGSSTDDFQLSSVTYTPNPPVVGQSVCITIQGTLSTPVTQGATIHVTATFWGINVYDQTSDLCAGLAGGATPCPIATTVGNVTDCITVPSNVPAGVQINLQATANNAGGERLFCIAGPLTFSS
ncbi:putative phospholipid transfer protein [Dissophora ornata]|nr:Phosphatidylglycerol/phosphatidylinositol transfer protein [Dissophora ornata]KAI8598670.1 putative phospholipid transfer protein [Dissophora ornata]